MIYNFIAWEIECGCNIDHDICTNSTCKTDVDCQRVVTYINGVIIEDHQLCIFNVAFRLPCNYFVKHFNGSTIFIEGMYCCRTTRCNENNTLLETIIRNELGNCMYCLCST